MLATYEALSLKNRGLGFVKNVVLHKKLLDLRNTSGDIKQSVSCFPQWHRGQNMESLHELVFVVAIVVYTLIAVVWDQKYWKIPNKLTIPMFFLGWIYQGVFSGWSGIGDGALGFLIGFGILFILWIIGSGGGGDVKLLGALSVWLGFKWSLYVFIASTVIVILITSLIVLGNMLTIGPKKMKKKLLATGKPLAAGEKPKRETVQDKQKRRIIAYALPIAIATWGLLISSYTLAKPALPWLM